MEAIRINSERGMAALIALMMIAMLTLLGLAALSSSDDEVTIAGNELQETRAFYAAEAGLEIAAAQMHTEYDSTGFPPVDLPVGTATVNGCTVTYSSTDDGAAHQEVLTGGTMAGLHALVKSFGMSSTGVSPIENVKVQLSQSFEAALVPIFQFAVFYENDLWTQPAEEMTVTGRVHVNGNMYLQASDKLLFNGRVTAAGEIHHGFPGGLYPGVNGGVYFKDAVGLYRNMYEAGYWLDADHPEWFQRATERWGGKVQDEAFGQEELNLPLTNSDGDIHKIIERKESNQDSYETKATFVIRDGVPYAKIGGLWQDVSLMLPAGTITSTSFYDAREKMSVSSTDIDMSMLKTSGFFPSNGVLYSSDHRSGYPGIRLKNGSNIGSPLSVFSENPLYVLGDYNTVNKQPAAVIADAVTFLSNNWKDANSTKNMNYRTTTPTTVNVSMISGDRDPAEQQYSGGLANLPRFLEDWDKTKFTYRGSMVNLWRTRQADGDWHYGDSQAYYTAPTRDYGFDTDLNDPNKLPPATPCVRVFQRTGWKQEYVGNDE